MSHILKSSIIFIALLHTISCGTDETASRINIGTGVVIYELTEQQYQFPFTVQVTDVNGAGVANQKVSLSAIPVSYRKGSYQLIDTDGDLEIDSWGIDDPNTPGLDYVTCTTEDTNHNGTLDAGEDINNNGTLEPTNSATLAQHPDNTPTLIGSNYLITDEFGFGYFSLVYPKSEALWSTIEITASTDVTGTESTENFTFVLLALIDDLQSIDTAPPGGVIASKYGTASVCTDPN
ncbi:MAG: hypothetical protein OQL09_00840 [Gammaproteobacteria bacterium]|nr:hypothetical protein [Gammaproteobacteria bacterium]